VLTAEHAAASAGGQAAFEQARAKTAGLLTEWTEHARRHGALSPPPFATAAASAASQADDGEIADITEAVRHDPREVMWQLCTPDDLSALDVTDEPQVVTFAPRSARQVLTDAVPPDTVWPSTGAHAGLLRLVALRDGIASPSWTGGEPL
jgi:hypothetical protein